jgi:hypothetical protein
VPVIVTSAEAAALLGVGSTGLRMLVLRGQLTPIRPGARPLLFRAADVWELQVSRLTAAERAERAELWAEVDAIRAGSARQG